MRSLGWIRLQGLYKGSLALVILQSVAIGVPVMLFGGGLCDLFGPCCLLESFCLEKDWRWVLFLWICGFCELIGFLLVGALVLAACELKLFRGFCLFPIMLEEGCVIYLGLLACWKALVWRLRLAVVRALVLVLEGWISLCLAWGFCALCAVVLDLLVSLGCFLGWLASLVGDVVVPVWCSSGGCC